MDLYSEHPASTRFNQEKERMLSNRMMRVLVSLGVAHSLAGPATLLAQQNLSSAIPLDNLLSIGSV
ncbi:MAG: hypothetical protein M3418_12375, partial [Gemmatimonadota bacterium]|nr:hypothetical protein [Gemmatimonadota bacterium]